MSPIPTPGLRRLDPEFNWEPVIWWLLAACATSAYALFVGPVAFMGDSYLLADRAKHIATGSFDLNNYGSLIYPPLYPLVIAPLFHLGAPATIHAALIVLNSVLIAAAVIPTWLLLRDHSRLEGVRLRMFTLLIALSPTWLTYVPMVLTEALFIPLLYWAAWFLLSTHRTGATRDYLLCGFLMAALLLTRSAAATVVLAVLFSWALMFPSLTPVRRRSHAIGIIIGLVALAVPVISWMIVERTWVSYQGGTGGYSAGRMLHELLTTPAVQVIKVQWLLNAAIYYWAAPLSVAGALLAAGMISDRRLPWRDPFAAFGITVLVLGAASIIVVAPISYGGGVLTWNKYFAPYTGLITIIALPLAAGMSRRQLGLALALGFLPLLVGSPYALACHFPDALTGFTHNARPWVDTPWLLNLGFAALLAATLPLFRPAPGSKPFWTAFVASALLVAGGLTQSAFYWANAGGLNVRNYHEGNHQLWEERQANPTIPIRFDPAAIGANSPTVLRTLFHLPEIVPPLTYAELSLGQNLPPRFLYLTARRIPGARIVIPAIDELTLYEIDATQGSSVFSYELAYGAGMGHAEPFRLGDAEVSIRWIEGEATFTVTVGEPVEGALIRINIATGDRQRELELAINGAVVGPVESVPSVLWNGAFDTLTRTTDLRAGANTITLRTAGEPLELPGGRRVHLLLVGEPVITQP